MEAPDRHRIVDTDIPRGVHAQIAIHRDIGDPAALLCLSDLLAPTGAENRSLEGTEIFLLDQRIAGLVAVDTVILPALDLNGFTRDRARVVDSQNLREPVRALARHVQHRLGVVGSGRDTHTLLGSQAPVRRMSHRLEETRRRVIAIRADDLPGRPVLEPNEKIALRPCGPLECRRGRPVQANVILAGSTMPNPDRAPTPGLKAHSRAAW
ncbi:MULTISPECIES: hypothetical protein [Bradyrhizobium]|uniref:hypothetical protein n=1 Tax=Bradyrhizobium TaxID=374 RepID=UPI0015A227B2|nr:MULTISPECIES: hypothetical protein [Bradyrhizobium]MCA6104500.1 hypothetical protein [Bradyrhizobium australafricanum]MCC8969525.1 hypothetical protein [Bradyrhizobium brasilense]